MNIVIERETDREWRIHKKTNYVQVDRQARASPLLQVVPLVCLNELLAALQREVCFDVHADARHRPLPVGDHPRATHRRDESPLTPSGVGFHTIDKASLVSNVSAVCQ